MSLFEPLSVRDVKLRNRIAVSPMCQYCGTDGFVNDWHLVHLGSRAVGGAGLVMTEASAVVPEGRISPKDLGIWKDEHIEGLARIVRFLVQHGAVGGMQIAHAGRKASTAEPWKGRHPLAEGDGGWRPIYAPSPIPFDGKSPVPQEITLDQIPSLLESFGAAAGRALQAGFQVLELHAAHGYLLHQFLSPLVNRRNDLYGGSFEGRIRLVCQVVEAIRKRWPERLPFFVRLSCVDWVEGGWTLEDTIALARCLKPLGVDLIDCSSGAIVPGVSIPLGPGYQVRFAERVRREAQIMTGAVGLITSPAQADTIIRSGQADLVLLARQFLRDPYWPLHAARELGKEAPRPEQYSRAW
jgi:2,4-dienoyl-CoA reductase-like NADH-dependent reductase (Old Yellow Enzyme family)